MKKQHFHGHRERLRKKYLEKGIESLNDYEILELILFYSIPVKDTKPVAKELLQKFGSIKNILAHLNLEEFSSIKGLGEKSYILFSLIKDIHKIIEKNAIIENKKCIKSLDDVIKFSKNILWDVNFEQFCCLFLNSKNEVLKFEILEQGTVNETYIYFRKLFEKAFKIKATALILIHNHPSGNATPSREDMNITREIVKIAAPLGITVHDHVIIAGDNYFSFKKENII